MAALSQETQTLWGFVQYVMSNPKKTFGGMTEQDFVNMAVLYADANNMGSDGIAIPGTDRTGPYLGDAAAANLFSLCFWPKPAGGTSAVAQYGTKVSANIAHYPEQHRA